MDLFFYSYDGKIFLIYLNKNIPAWKIGIAEKVVITKHICQGQNFGQIYFFRVFSFFFQAFVKISKRFGSCIYSGNSTSPLVLLNFKNFLKYKMQDRNICYLICWSIKLKFQKISNKKFRIFINSNQNTLTQST